MIKVGVICAMEEEIRTLLAKQTHQQETVIASQHYFEGQIDGIDVILVQSGIGKVQAAMTTALLLATFKPDVVRWKAQRLARLPRNFTPRLLLFGQ